MSPPRGAEGARPQGRACRTIRNSDEAIAWHTTYGPKAPRVGDVAPDFDLPEATGTCRIRLSSFRGRKPVALVFGSFT